MPNRKLPISSVKGVFSSDIHFSISRPGDLLLDVESLEPVLWELLVRVLVHLLRHAGKDGAEVRAAERAHLQHLLRSQVRPESQESDVMRTFSFLVPCILLLI